MTYLMRAALKPNQAIRGNQGARLVPDEGGTQAVLSGNQDGNQEGNQEGDEGRTYTAVPISDIKMAIKKAIKKATSEDVHGGADLGCLEERACLHNREERERGAEDPRRLEADHHIPQPKRGLRGQCRHEEAQEPVRRYKRHGERERAPAVDGITQSARA
jgi:hypothetical protein